MRTNINRNYFGILTVSGEFYGKNLQYVPKVYLQSLLTQNICPKQKTRIKDFLNSGIDNENRISVYIPPVKKENPKPKANKPTSEKPTQKAVLKASNNVLNDIDKITWAKEQCMKIMAENKFMNLIELDWNVKLGNAKNSAGRCTRRSNGFDVKKYITLSKFWIQKHDKEKVLDTITHEIAHAIDIEQRGTTDHSFIWVNIHRELGGSGKRAFNSKIEDEEEIYKYHAVCENCGIIGGWQRKPKGNYYECKKCGGIASVK